MGFVSTFESLDCFPSSLELNLKGKTAYSNWCSLFFSLLYYITLFITIFFNTQKYLTDGSPSVVTTRSPFDTSEVAIVDKSAFKTTFLAIDSKLRPYKGENASPVTSTLIEIENNFIVPKPESVGIVRDCTPEDGSENVNEQAVFLATKSKCIEFTEDFKLGGDIFTGSIAHLVAGSFDFDMCANQPSLCQNPAVSEVEAVNDIVLVLGYETREPDMNVDSGFTENAYSRSIPVSPAYNYMVSFIVQKTTVETDRNFIFNFFDPEETEFLSIIDVTISQSVKQKFDKIGLNFEFVFSPQEITYERGYQTLDDLIANIQGVVDLVALILAFILSFFQEGVITKVIAQNCYFEGNKAVKTDNLIRSDGSDTHRVKANNPMALERTLMDSVRMAFGLSPNKKLETASEMAEQHTDYLEVIRLLMKQEEKPEEERMSVNDPSELRIEPTNK